MRCQHEAGPHRDALGTEVLVLFHLQLAMAYLCNVHDMVWPWVKLADRDGGFKIKDGSPYQHDLLTRYAALVVRHSP